MKNILESIAMSFIAFGPVCILVLFLTLAMAVYYFTTDGINIFDSIEIDE